MQLAALPRHASCILISVRHQTRNADRITIFLPKMDRMTTTKSNRFQGSLK